MPLTEVVVGALVGAAVGWPGIWYQGRIVRESEERTHRAQLAAEERALAVQREADILARERALATDALKAVDTALNALGRPGVWDPGFREQTLVPAVDAAKQLGRQLRGHNELIANAAAVPELFYIVVSGFPQVRAEALRGVVESMQTLHQICMAVLNGTEFPPPIDVTAVTAPFREAVQRAFQPT